MYISMKLVYVVGNRLWMDDGCRWHCMHVRLMHALNYYLLTYLLT